MFNLFSSEAFLSFPLSRRTIPRACRVPFGKKLHCVGQVRKIVAAVQLYDLSTAEFKMRDKSEKMQLLTMH